MTDHSGLVRANMRGAYHYRGTLEPFAITFIKGASNSDCWKLPS
jgi:hypothetical protein